MNDDNRPRNSWCAAGAGLAGIRVADIRVAQYTQSKTIADLDERIERLEATVEILGAKAESGDEALCLYSEVVRLLEAEAIVRPTEVDNLLARIQVLTKK